MGFVIPARDVPVVVTSLLFTSIAFILVLTRLYTRVVMFKNAGADDYIMTAAMVSSIFDPTLLSNLIVKTSRDCCGIDLP